MTQKEMIMNYMERFGSISPMEAFTDLGITKLATRVSELRRDGNIIDGTLEKSHNRFGTRVEYMRYSIGKEAEK